MADVSLHSLSLDEIVWKEDMEEEEEGEGDWEDCSDGEEEEEEKEEEEDEEDAPDLVPLVPEATTGKRKRSDETPSKRKKPAVENKAEVTTANPNHS